MRLKILLKIRNAGQILPSLLYLVTGKHRDKVLPGVDFEWSKDSWTHNLFRAWDVLFWRSTGIRIESSINTFKDKDGVAGTLRTFYTVEAVFKYVEHSIRSLNQWKLEPVKIYIPALALATGGPITPSPYLLAIAFVNNGGYHAGASGTGQSTGSIPAGTTNGLIFVNVTSNSAITWNSVATTDGACTVIDTVVTTSDVRVATYYFLGTTTANQVVTATASGSTVINICASTYSGVKQTGQPDAHATGTATTGTSFTQSLTTVAGNCWMMMGISYGDISGHLLSAGSNTTMRENNIGQGVASTDTNAPMTPAGNYSMSVSEDANDKWAVAIASFAPAVSSTASFSTMSMMGVG